MRRKFIIDTDPGIDDAMACFMALDAHRRGDIQILGFTLVSGNSTIENHLKNILRILTSAPETFGDIPVFVGAREGLVNKFQWPPDRTAVHGSDGFGNVIFERPASDHPVKPVVRKEHAVNAINRLVNDNPGEVTVVTLGPLTNIALALKLNPELETKVKEFVMMGGNMEGVGNITSTAEFNFYSDPEAAHVVFKKLENLGEVKATVVTWELCRKYRFSWDWRCDNLAHIPSQRSSLMNILEEARNKSTRYPGEWTPCDSYAMAVALNRHCIKKSNTFKGVVEVHGQHTRGLLVLDKRPVDVGDTEFNVEIVVEIDTDLMKQLFIQALKDDL